MADNLKAALKYAGAGYGVLPVYGLRGKTCTCSHGTACKTPGKHPMLKAWQDEASTNRKAIEKWFGKRPDAHVGITPPKGHCIIDVDPRNGGDKTFEALTGTAKLPKNTPVQDSGGGGWHLVFKGEPTGPLGKGIDVKRHRRGYVVAWPAGHVSGGRYAWRTAPWDVAAAPLPPTLRGSTSERVANPAQAAADAVPAPLASVRDALAYVNADDYQRWINFGMALKHAYGDEGESVWLEWSQTSSKYKDGDEDRWRTFDKNRDRPLVTARSIMRVARSCGYRPLTNDFDQSLWALADIGDAYDSEPAPLDWVFEPCIPAAKVTLLAGAGGSSKSYLALTLAMQLAIGEALGPFKPSSKPGKALLLVAEESKVDVARRLRAVRNAVGHSAAQGQCVKDRVGVLPVRGMDWRLVRHDEAGDLHETERVQYLIDEIRALGDVRLLVLDPLIAFNGANENDNMEMGRLMFTFDRIAEQTGAAVLVLHHVSKGGQVASLNDATQAVVRGASALVDNARSTLLLTRMPRADAPQYNIASDQAGRFVVARVVKNNYGPHTPDIVFEVQEGGALRHAPEVLRVHATPAQGERAMVDATRPAALLRAMLANPKASQRQLAESAFPSPVSPTVINRLLQRLLEDGHVRRVGLGTTASYDVTKAGRAAAGTDESDLSDIL